MQKIIFLFLLLMCTNVAYPQATAGLVQENINQQVWYPFIDAYNNLDNEAFMSIHSDNIIRVVRDREEIMFGEEYAEAIAMNVKWHKENKVTRRIELSFLERVTKADTAFEVGYYKVTNNRGGNKRTFYGTFTMVLEKTDGIWKILMDTDTSNRGTISENDFRNGNPLVKIR